MATSTLINKVESLTPEQAAQVEALIDSMQSHPNDQRLAYLTVSEQAFAKVWDDPENDVYDAL